MRFGDIWRGPNGGARYQHRLPKPPATIQMVIDALALTDEVSNGSWRGATPEEIADAEAALGRTFPDDVKTLYSTYNGGDFIGGNVQFDPLFPTKYGELWPQYANDASLAEMESFGVVTAGDEFREYGFPVPPELVMLGSNGSESWYGIWLPVEGNHRPVVVEVGEGFERDALAIVGDDLASFLAGHCAYYLLLYLGDGFDLVPALDALGVPEVLRRADDEDLYFDLLTWANPNLPDKRPSVYGGRHWTPEEINEFTLVVDE
jgi:hypothetical protein